MRSGLVNNEHQLIRFAASQVRLGSDAARKVVDMASRSAISSSRRFKSEAAPGSATLIISRKSRTV